MNERYIPKDIEQKWQAVWSETSLYEASEDTSRKKIYATPMLPYPSGAGLHIGHVRNYSISDAIARFYRQRGYNVMSTIGWDSFGLPAENYAIKTGIPPRESTATNIANFKNQLQRLGMSFAWDRELNTSDPEYYKWTQWLFLQFFNDDLAYQATNLQWWCPKCKTVLANEQVENGCCWRHEDTPVEKRKTKQWFFKITKYADELLAGLDDIDWPEGILAQQRNWIGRSVGADVTFQIEDSKDTITVFTTRHDTQYGVTFLVLAPEHELVKSLTTDDQKTEVETYVAAAAKKSDLDRQKDNKVKTGVFSGSYAINPINNQKLPIWIADYVLTGYGTGAVMGVPGHDDRDKLFAETYELPIVKVYETPGDEEDMHTEGTIINSESYNELPTAKAREVMLADMTKAGYAAEKVQYKMRDWLISRQRYWGAPIPIIHCESCGAVPVPEADLPVVLPEVDDFAPTGKESSVLAAISDWVNVDCPSCQKPAKRETDTMDGYVCSSWYMHRYTDSNNETMAWDPEKVNYWFPVDFYCGGDHAVAHLLYFRFWNHFFADKGLIDQSKKEPVKKLVYNGYINAADGYKMSKSRGNVVDPLEVIDSGYGADALRMFELFIGPYDQDVAWNINGVPGTHRFIQRVWALVYGFLQSDITVDTPTTDSDAAFSLVSATHKTIRKVTDDMEQLKFNTAIAACMELVNTMNSLQSSNVPFQAAASEWRISLGQLLQLLAPFAPHMTEELWHELGFADQSIHVSSWPAWNELYVKEDLITVIVQVNGKLRASLAVAPDTVEGEIAAMALEQPKVIAAIDGKPLIKQIFIPNKIINFVV